MAVAFAIVACMLWLPARTTIDSPQILSTGAPNRHQFSYETKTFGVLGYLTRRTSRVNRILPSPTQSGPREFVRNEWAWGRLAGTTLLTIATGSLYIYAARWFTRRKPLIGACDECGYSLEGLTSTTCPECGAAIHRTPPAEASHRVPTAD